MLAEHSDNFSPTPDRFDPLPAPAMIEVAFTSHALLQARRRGISFRSLELVLVHHDRSQKVPGLGRALWVSPKRRKSLVKSGLPAAEVDRLAGVRLIVGIRTDAVYTVEHMLARRHWA
jgi:hypothetical protein